MFVNNVSLGVYAEAVQRDSYRDAKLRTIADTMPEVLGSHGEGIDLRWTGPDGHHYETSAVVLVSNDPYRLGRVLGSGTRPRLDEPAKLLAQCAGLISHLVQRAPVIRSAKASSYVRW